MGTVIAFYGADHKCGTSMIAQSVAEYIASNIEKTRNVILVHTKGGTGEEYSPRVNESLENIRPYLSTRLVDIKSIKQKSRYKENLFIIGGASKPASAGLFSMDMTGYLFEAMAEDFDYVICDAGSEIDHALTIGALCKSDFVYAVLTQSEHALRRFEWVTPVFTRLNMPIEALVINKFVKDEVNDIDLIKERTGINRIFCVKESKFGRKAEYDSKTLFSIRDSRFIRDIALLAKDITDRNQNV